MGRRGTVVEANGLHNTSHEIGCGQFTRTTWYEVATKAGMKKPG